MNSRDEVQWIAYHRCSRLNIEVDLQLTRFHLLLQLLDRVSCSTLCHRYIEMSPRIDRRNPAKIPQPRRRNWLSGGKVSKWIGGVVNQTQED